MMKTAILIFALVGIFITCVTAAVNLETFGGESDAKRDGNN